MRRSGKPPGCCRTRSGCRGEGSRPPPMSRAAKRAPPTGELSRLSWRFSWLHRPARRLLSFAASFSLFVLYIGCTLLNIIYQARPCVAPGCPKLLWGSSEQGRAARTSPYACQARGVRSWAGGAMTDRNRPQTVQNGTEWFKTGRNGPERSPAVTGGPRRSKTATPARKRRIRRDKA